MSSETLFCTQCGSGMSNADRFCRRCGAHANATDRALLSTRTAAVALSLVMGLALTGLSLPRVTAAPAPGQAVATPAARPTVAAAVTSPTALATAHPTPPSTPVPAPVAVPSASTAAAAEATPTAIATIVPNVPVPTAEPTAQPAAATDYAGSWTLQVNMLDGELRSGLAKSGYAYSVDDAGALIDTRAGRKQATTPSGPIRLFVGHSESQVTVDVGLIGQGSYDCGVPIAKPLPTLWRYTIARTCTFSRPGPGLLILSLYFRRAG